MSLSLFETDVELYRPESVFTKGDRAPALKLYRFVPPSGSPNRLLERWGPWYALERVTEEHRLMADWIRAQGWGSEIPKGCWRYISASKRLKDCRNQLQEMVQELEEEEAEYGID